MFDSAELGHKVDADAYDAEVPKLREQLLHAQAQVFRKAEFPVLVVISGMEGAGKGDTLHVLNEWMDPHHIRTHAFDEPDCVEAEHPRMWRFWQALPRAGEMGVYFRAWYREAMYDRIYDHMKRAELERRLDAIVDFEEMLANEGALIVKYWLHLSKKAQAKALREMDADPRARWRVKKSDWRNHEHYADFKKTAAVVIERTSVSHAPWVVVDASDARFRRLTVGRTLLAAMKKRLGEPANVHVDSPPIVPAVDNRALLRDLDLTKALEKDDYEKRLAKAQAELAELARLASKKKRAAVFAFEGMDAAGKGGAIRRVTEALDARHFRITPIAAPTDEERAHPYLWRFWRALPRAGMIGIFDRSWYGRVLVERVEKFSPESDWMRAYGEINDFEAQLAEHGIIVAKFWLAISKDEQLRRFRSREDEGYKQFKITGEDWRNRKKWGAYEQAACDMIDRTSTASAPWVVVEANDKPFARVKVLEAVVARLRSALGK